MALYIYTLAFEGIANVDKCFICNETMDLSPSLYIVAINAQLRLRDYNIILFSDDT